MSASLQVATLHQRLDADAKDDRCASVYRDADVTAMQTHSLMPLVTSFRRLRKAARQCMRRASSPGYDTVTWRQYRDDLTGNLMRLSQRLDAGVWQPSPVRTVSCRFITGKELRISIPTVEDRIVHKAICNALVPILEATVLANWVSGFLRGRSRLTAVRQAMAYMEGGLVYVADVDVADVSGRITAAEVCDLVAACVSDGSLLCLVHRIVDQLPTPMVVGSGLSPLLIHLRLAPIDRALAPLSVVRFADNYAVFCSSLEEAAAAYRVIEQTLAEYGLWPAPAKSSVRSGVNPEDLFLVGA